MRPVEPGFYRNAPIIRRAHDVRIGVIAPPSCSSLTATDRPDDGRVGEVAAQRARHLVGGEACDFLVVAFEPGVVAAAVESVREARGVAALVA